MATGTAHATLEPLQARATGYVHGSAYASAVAAFPDLERQELVRAMPPKFQALADPILHIIATGAEPAGPYLGNPNLPEKMLQAFAEYEQNERGKKRLRRWNLVLAVLAGIMLILSPLVTLVVQAWFFPPS
jgi:hypothetical protein